MSTTAHTLSPNTGLLSTDQLAAYLQVPVGTVRSWRWHGKGPRAIHVGRYVRYLPSDVAEWLEASR